MYRLSPAVLLSLATLVGASKPLAVTDARAPLVTVEEWSCSITVEENLNIHVRYAITDAEVTSRAIRRDRDPEVPTVHYKIIENSHTGLMAVTNSSWDGGDGFTRSSEVIALDKRDGSFVRANVYLSDGSSADASKLRGKCRKD
jgi:hypothetical protein